MKLIAAAILLLALCGCGGPFLYVNSLPNISGEVDPYPIGYERAVSRTLLKPGETALVSEPQQSTPWSIRDPIGWHVCVQRENGEVIVAMLARGRVEGTMEPPQGYCGLETRMAHRIAG